MSTSLYGRQKSAKSSPQFRRHPTRMTALQSPYGRVLTTGHVPAEISKVYWFFLRHGGTIKCRMSTDRHCRSLLEQGRLKVACELIFVADDQQLLKKLKMIVSTRTH